MRREWGTDRGAAAAVEHRRRQVDAFRTIRKELDAFARWRDLPPAALEDAGQHEFLNWVCLAGAMQALGRRAEIVDYVESYVFNSDKCFAVFRP